MNVSVVLGSSFGSMAHTFADVTPLVDRRPCSCFAPVEYACVLGGPIWGSYSKSKVLVHIETTVAYGFEGGVLQELQSQMTCSRWVSHSFYTARFCPCKSSLFGRAALSHHQCLYYRLTPFICMPHETTWTHYKIIYQICLLEPCVWDENSHFL